MRRTLEAPRLSAVAVAFLVPMLVVAGAAMGDPPAGASIDGIRCDRAESANFHIHQHLAIYDRGKPVAIPNDVGRPVLGNCLYWLHTHTSDGIIHVESPVVRAFHLGDFFNVWGEPLSATRIGPLKVPKGKLRIYLDGRPYAGDPRTIELTQHADIVLEAGPPYPKPSPFSDWKGQ
jgi:hypothetical protein